MPLVGGPGRAGTGCLSYGYYGDPRLRDEALFPSPADP